MTKNTGLKHNQDAVIRMAIGLLEDRFDLTWPPPANAPEDADAER